MLINEVDLLADALKDCQEPWSEPSRSRPARLAEQVAKSRAADPLGAAQGDRRAGRGGRRGADGAVLRRPLPDHRRARAGQDAAGEDAGADPRTCSFKRIQFTPDLMPADITGTEVLDEEARAPRAAVRARADLRAHHPGRRDQPHAAEDAGRAARGDAGAARHGRRPDLSRSSGRSSCWRRRTRSSWKAPIRCPRRSSIASCSTSS